MTPQLIPAELLQNANKILFIAHLALGDFTYLQNCFRAFSQAFPHIKIHLWIDELRRTSDATQWENLKKYSLYDWVNACPMFEKIYSQTYSPQLLNQSIQAAQAENYPIVVSFAVLHRHRYAELARKISPQGFIAGQKKHVRFFDIPKQLSYRKLDAFIPDYQFAIKHRTKNSHVAHISHIYADWFRQLFNIDIPESDRYPFVDIPEPWKCYATEQLQNWNFNNGEKVVFLNGFSKSKDRSWPLERVFELAIAMRQQTAWRNANFIINVVPECMTEARRLATNLATNFQLTHVQLFSAEENFFQLPAVLSFCQLIISVETAVMHLANAVHVPVIALMRQTSPEWTPINTQITTVITVKNYQDWINEITVDQVLTALQ